MSKRTVYTIVTALPPTVTRQIGVDMLHDHDEMIELNPLVIEHHPIKPPKDCPAEEYHCAWHSLTDKLSYFPGVKGQVTYKAAFHDMPWGIQTHIMAPAGLDIREKWSIGGNMPGEPREVLELGLKGAPRDGLYLREDCDMRCNLMLTPYVKRNLKKSHEVLVARLLSKGEVIEDRSYRQTIASTVSTSSAAGSMMDPDSKSPSYTSPSLSLASLPPPPRPVIANATPTPPAYAHPHGAPPPPLAHADSHASRASAHDPRASVASGHNPPQHPHPAPPQYYQHPSHTGGSSGSAASYDPAAYAPPHGAYPPPQQHPALRTDPALPAPLAPQHPAHHSHAAYPQPHGYAQQYAGHPHAPGGGTGGAGAAAPPPGGQEFVAELPHEPVQYELGTPPQPQYQPPPQAQRYSQQSGHAEMPSPQPSPRFAPPEALKSGPGEAQGLGVRGAGVGS